jgi:hypothetical protein
MDVVDNVNRAEYALEMSGAARQLAVTPPMAASHRR